jgi:dihydroorotase
MSIDSIVILMPDDFHHHFRDGRVLSDVVENASRNFCRVIAMPNLKPPVRTATDAIEYRRRILTSSPNIHPKFEPIMTIYLTDTTT